MGLPAALAQTGSETANEVELIGQEVEAERARSRALEQHARELSQELEALRIQLVTAARDTQEREVLVANLELQIIELQSEISRRRGVLAQRYRQLTGTLSALTGLFQDAPRAFFLYPGLPLDAVRGSILLQSATPALGERATILRSDLAALEAVRLDLIDKIAQMSLQDAALADDRARLEALLDKKRTLYEQTADQARAANDRLRELVEKSGDLKELMAALDADRIARESEETARRSAEAETLSETAFDQSVETLDKATALAAIPAAKPDGIRVFPSGGLIGAPVVGVLVQQYGQDTGFGQTAKGILVETRPNGQVLAPYDGKAVFAGPFRDLGHVLIIEHDGGYHTVLAGFERIDMATGHWMLSGEPVGIMPVAHAPVSSINDSTGSGMRPRFYMELRRNGQPVNPLRWITAGSIRVNG